MVGNSMQEADVRLPPESTLPPAVQKMAYLTRGRRLMQYLAKRHGGAFTMRLPVFGPAVIVSDRELIKQVFALPPETVRGVEPNLSEVIGPGSIFGLQGEAHLQRRKLLMPPFHGRRMRAYVPIVEDEFRRETATWPHGREFPTLPSMMRITLNTIIRAAFGAEGDDLVQLQTVMPRIVDLGSRLAMLPWLRTDLGPWSPWERFLSLRRQYDSVFASLIAKAEADPDFANRRDVLSLMLQARQDDGSAMDRGAIADDLLGLVGAGHETTAVTLAWAIERIRRQPALLDQLVAEVDSGGSALLQATIYEVQRVRPVIDSAARRVIAPSVRVGPWVIPAGYTIVVNIGLSHRNAANFPQPESFDPRRFLNSEPDRYAWVPFGGGVRRCPGASFANMEIVTVLRALLSEFELVPTSARGERFHSRGVAFAPAKGAAALLFPRAKPLGRG